MRKLIAGNWKMNGLRADGIALARALVERVGGTRASSDLVLCPPATLLMAVAEVIRGGPIALGGQDCHTEAKGAHTGDISAAMLRDAGCRYVILGHSERRSDHHESGALICAKVAAALAAGLVPIVCVGETTEERDRGEALTVVASQLAGSLPDDIGSTSLVIAYEPVWAIGTGRTPSTEDVAAVHAHIRRELAGKVADAAATLILYGGSVKPGNAGELLSVANVDGALVGGASLVTDDFWAIAKAAGGG
ncbi:MAG TPA: triose-phosphate isomerase [Stellaceae bacterium]|nr:triose-phosphate isomerase [Stellaceae bacterium]